MGAKHVHSSESAKTQKKRLSGINVKQIAVLGKLICLHTGYGIASLSGTHKKKT